MRALYMSHGHSLRQKGTFGGVEMFQILAVKTNWATKFRGDRIGRSFSEIALLALRNFLRSSQGAKSNCEMVNNCVFRKMPISTEYADFDRSKVPS